MSSKKIFPTVCPSCGGVLSVKSMHCSECETAVSGEFEVHPLLRLTAEEQQFVTAFIRSFGYGYFLLLPNNAPPSVVRFGKYS